jgi:TctA family transporter
VDAFDNFLTGTVTLFSDPLGILIFFGGVVGGMLFGAIPGVSMLTLAAILLPLFTAPGFMAVRLPRSCSTSRGRRKTRRPLSTVTR